MSDVWATDQTSGARLASHCARATSTLIFAPTGTGKTLTAFLWCLDRLMFTPTAGEGSPLPGPVHVSPLKALACRRRTKPAATAGGNRGNCADARGESLHSSAGGDPHGRHPAAERARFQREPADILITTPESLYLLLTSQARDALVSVDTIIIDEIHALVPTKRGAHLAVIARAVDRARRASPAANRTVRHAARPLEEVARFLGDGRSHKSQSIAIARDESEAAKSSASRGRSRELRDRT